MRISKLSDYSIVLLGAMVSLGPDTVVSAHALSVSTKLPEPTVSKILKILCKADILRSIRGIHGGYVLNKDSCDISVGDVIVAIDGPVMLTSCVDEHEPDCSLNAFCTLRGRWDKVNDAVRKALDDVSLQDIIDLPIKDDGLNKYYEGGGRPYGSH